MMRRSAQAAVQLASLALLHRAQAAPRFRAMRGRRSIAERVKDR